MAAEAPDVLGWDGDSYQADSFTVVLERALLLSQLVRAGQPLLELVASLREEDRGRFEAAWAPRRVAIRVHLCPSSLDWQQLGAHALEQTQSRCAVCLGGGAVVKQEFEAAPEGCSFHLFPVARPTPDGSGIEPSSLLECAGRPGLVVHDA